MSPASGGMGGSAGGEGMGVALTCWYTWDRCRCVACPRIPQKESLAPVKSSPEERGSGEGQGCWEGERARLVQEILALMGEVPRYFFFPWRPDRMHHAL